MVKTRKSVVAIVAACIACLAAPAGADYARTPDEDLFRTDEERYGHLKYFGFYASAMFSWNFTEELAPFTNLTWIHVGNVENPISSANQFVNRLKEARDAGVYATLSIEPFLFRDEEGHPRTGQEIEDFLVELRARIENEELLGTVAMIYPMDEPFRNFRRARDPTFVEQYVTGEVYEDIHADLAFVNEQIKLVFPEIPLGVILSGHEIFHDFFSIPENFDWVGFDCYDNLFRNCDDRSHVQFYFRLLDHMQPHQRLMAVPETWVTGDGVGNPEWPDVLLQRLRQHYEIALNEPRFVAFIPFIWSFDVEGEPPGPGLNNFPEFFDDGENDRGTAFLNHVIGIGQQIKNGTHEFPNMLYEDTEPHPARPVSNVIGEVTAINRRGVISAWAINNALPHKNLRVRIRVRDLHGRLLHKSDVERTFIRDDDLFMDPRIGQAIIGTHGYRHQIPGKILRHHQGETLWVRLTVFPDGEDQVPAVAIRYKYRPRILFEAE